MGSNQPNEEGRAPRQAQGPAPSASSSSSQEAADLAQAFKDLARGEQTAAALEKSLSALESKLDAILAAYETQESPEQGSERNDANADPDSGAVVLQPAQAEPRPGAGDGVGEGLNGVSAKDGVKARDQDGGE